jgi:hypothetical protein
MEKRRNGERESLLKRIRPIHGSKMHRNLWVLHILLCIFLPLASKLLD